MEDLHSCLRQLEDLPKQLFFRVWKEETEQEILDLTNTTVSMIPQNMGDLAGRERVFGAIEQRFKNLDMFGELKQSVMQRIQQLNNEKDETEA